MSYGLNDMAVKKIAAVAHHANGGSMHQRLSDIYHSLNTPETIDQLTKAHTTDAMQHKFKSKDEENTFKRHIATAAAMNRGTLDVIPVPKIANPKA
jgi:mannitol/fructose-specific phosphotransferase system IIA component (Ntr-type)